MQFEIVEYGSDPDRFGSQVVDIIAECFSGMAVDLEKEPTLSILFGESMAANGFLAKQLRKASEHAAGNGHEFLHQWEKSLRGGNSLHLVAVGQDGRAVGSGMIDIVGSGYFDYGPEISDMYVAPSEQRKGIGSALLKRLEEYASRRDREENGGYEAQGHSLIFSPSLAFYSKREYGIYYNEVGLWGDDGFVLPSVPVRKSFRTR